MPRLFCSGPLALPPPTQYRPWSLLLFPLSAWFSLSLSCMLSPISFCISLVPAFLPILSMRNCLCSAFSQAHIHTHTHTTLHFSSSSFSCLHSVISPLFLFSLHRHIFLMSPLCSQSSLFCFLHVSLLLHPSVRSILSRGFTAGRSLLRPAPCRNFTEASSAGREQERHPEILSCLLPFLHPMFESRREKISQVFLRGW